MNTYSLKRLLKNKVFITFLLLGVLEPRCVLELSELSGGIWRGLHILFRLDCFIALLAIAMLLLMTFSSLSKFSVLVIGFEGWILISDIVNDLNISGDMELAFQIIEIVLLVEVYFKYKIEFSLIDQISFLFGFFILINIFTVLIFPDGFYMDDRGWSGNYFFGYKNSHIYLYIPYMVLLSLTHLKKYGKLGKSYYAMIFFMLVGAIKAESSTTIVAMLCMVLAIVFLKNRDIFIFKRTEISMIVSVILSIGFIIFGIQNQYGDIIKKVFQKDITFSGRLPIWEMAMTCAIKKPIMGNGDTSLPLNWSWDVTQCHNKWLDLFYVGGVVLLGLFVMLLIVVCKANNNNKNYLIRNILCYSFWAYGILFIMESRRPDIWMFIVFAFAYHALDMEIKLKNKRIKFILSK